MKELIAMTAVLMSLANVSQGDTVILDQGCAKVAIMSELTPGKVLYYNYADPTCPAEQPGKRFQTTKDPKTGDLVTVEISPR